VRPAQHPPRTLVGGRSARYRVGNRTWELPVEAFWQAHRGAAEVFAGIAADWLADHVDGAAVWDLYGGAGVFAGAALDAGAAQVCVVDTDAAALGAADAVFAGQHVRTRRSAVTPSAIDGLPAPGAVILDPPRSGAGRAVIEAVVAAGPATIVHVGCDPASFARDVATAVGAGYRLAEVRGLDAFPLTHHVEAMALLLRDSPRP
jgi:tRNA/tmRNA/rRNA uracil-C5-methylase (TrmA/RlmC/RlmD family)